MSNKRALVAAVLNVTAASDVFTQDLEDLEESEKPTSRRSPRRPSKRASPVNDAPPSPGARRPAAPLDEWLEAFTRPDNAKALEALWRGVTQPDLWETWSPSEQVQLMAAKNAAKKRLGLA